VASNLAFAIRKTKQVLKKLAKADWKHRNKLLFAKNFQP